MVHPQAHILKAIADGEPVQCKFLVDSDWWDFNPEKHAFHTQSGIQWRLKPKNLVKKYLWVVSHTFNNRCFSISNGYYKDLADFNTKHMDGIYVPVQRIDASMIEVEE